MFNNLKRPIHLKCPKTEKIKCLTLRDVNLLVSAQLVVSHVSINNVNHDGSSPRPYSTSKGPWGFGTLSATSSFHLLKHHHCWKKHVFSITQSSWEKKNIHLSFWRVAQEGVVNNQIRTNFHWRHAPTRHSKPIIQHLQSGPTKLGYKGIGL